MQTEQQGTATPRAGRPRTGHVYRHGDHFDIRIRLADGRRGKPQHLAPHITEEQARHLSAQASALALEEGATREPSATPNELVKEWVERWFADRTRRGVDGKNDRGTWKKWIAPYLDTLPIRDVAPADVERIVERLDEAMLGGEIHGQTPGKVWSMVQAAFRDARSSKTRSLRVRTDNPTDDIRPPDAGDERSRPWLYPCEFSALVSCERVPVRWRRLFVLATYLYLRAGEVAAMMVEDVDLVGGVVLIHRAQNRAGRRSKLKRTKTGITHRVPIEAPLRPLLEVLVAEARAEGRTKLVTMPPMCDLPDQLRRYLPRAGVTRSELFANDGTRAPMNFHDLRATGITWRAVRGDDVLKIQRAVGHKSLATTQKYIRVAEVVGRDIGEPFPSLPAAILTTDLTKLETARYESSQTPDPLCEPPIGIYFGGGKEREPLPRDKTT